VDGGAVATGVALAETVGSGVGVGTGWTVAVGDADPGARLVSAGVGDGALVAVGLGLPQAATIQPALSKDTMTRRWCTVHDLRR